jgi:hypothetical protein
MTHQLFDAWACNGACETERGCDCWTGSRKAGKVSEADLDARRAEREAAILAWRLRYMQPRPLTDDALAAMINDGTLSGPYKRTEPVCTTWRQRISRFVRRHLIDWETPRAAP